MSDPASPFGADIELDEEITLIDGLDEDGGIETAVVLSLFTDRRAQPGDPLPDDTAGRRGWWGDAFPAIEGDRIGSRLWLLSREKQVPAVLARAREYALEALQWMIDDGIAESVNVSAEVVSPGVLGLQIQIARSHMPVAKYRFETFWKGA
jgi:phage gp46-like protein